jgi:hypothetical protein
VLFRSISPIEIPAVTKVVPLPVTVSVARLIVIVPVRLLKESLLPQRDMFPYL